MNSLGRATVLLRTAIVWAVALCPARAFGRGPGPGDLTLGWAASTAIAGPRLDGRFVLTLERDLVLDGRSAAAADVMSPSLLPDITAVHGGLWTADSEPLLQPDLSMPGINAREGWLVSAGRLGGLAAGAWAAALFHEFGHAMVAWSYGYRFSWPTSKARSELFLPEWDINQQNIPPTRLRNLGMAGFVLSAALSEGMLASDTFPKSDTFVDGFLLYDLVNAVGYVARDIDSVSRGGAGIGDIRDMNRGGIPRQVVYVVLLARSAIVLARVLADRDFLRVYYWWDSSRPP